MQRFGPGASWRASSIPALPRLWALVILALFFPSGRCCTGSWRAGPIRTPRPDPPATDGTVELPDGRRGMALLPDTPEFEAWLTAREVVDLAAVVLVPTLVVGASARLATRAV